MTKMLSADAVTAVESVTEEVTQTPVLIAEQAVVFSTAAALRVRPAKTSRGLIAVLRGIFVDSTASARATIREGNEFGTCNRTGAACGDPGG
jgi:hypothetical protein